MTSSRSESSGRAPEWVFEPGFEDFLEARRTLERGRTVHTRFWTVAVGFGMLALLQVVPFFGGSAIGVALIAYGALGHEAIGRLQAHRAWANLPPARRPPYRVASAGSEVRIESGSDVRALGQGDAVWHETPSHLVVVEPGAEPWSLPKGGLDDIEVERLRAVFERALGPVR